jgi:hypothetical protein
MVVPQRKINYHTTQRFLKACHILKETVMLKSVCILTILARAYDTQVLNPWYLQKKIGSPQWLLAQYGFQI